MGSHSTIYCCLHDQSVHTTDEGPSLPTKQNEEFRPFIRRLPEFKFWHSATKGIVIAMICTFFDAFNVPVFWPILVMYFIMLFCITMKRQIKVSYGAASSVFSRKQQFPSFFRTVHPNKDVVEVIVNIILHFDWRWVAFLNIDNDYGKDGQEVFRKLIRDTEICLAYAKGLNHYTDYSQIFQQIEAQRVNILIVFAPEWTAEALIESAIRLNVTNKVWIAGDTWSLNDMLPREKGIKNIGTVLGVSQSIVTIPGFSDFIYSSKRRTHCGIARRQTFCNQVCNCSSLSAEDLISTDPSFSFPVYSAVYAVANALHNVLQCGADQCNDSITVYPHMVLAELKKSNFTILNQSVEFDENGDPKFGSYSIVFWNKSGDAQEIGYYKVHPFVNFFINSTKIEWHTNRDVPTSRCSPECPVGYEKHQLGIHKCCFTCEICSIGTYVNSTGNLHIWDAVAEIFP
ncbi:hypothetical protein F2P81_011757 [Scophthalmus maximus]|uniref:Receptor ligand binding region domain-containing protein n=1 Tax=Scophthalmus maximus TaxID=52904 RepID=A0A6A4SUT6_SCOMX|nr:hypothetical protein F2P81_011757 [Scophthalmus maximus]